jgi:hypothetical protein
MLGRLCPRLGTLSAIRTRVSASPAPLLRLLVIVVALAASTGCGARPDLDKELATARSWTATARLAVEERRAGATTATYTSQLHDRAANALDEERTTLGKAARTPDDRARARSALDSLALAVRALDDASRP